MTMVYCHNSLHNAILADDVVLSWQANKRHNIEIQLVKAHVVGLLFLTSWPTYFVIFQSIYFQPTSLSISPHDFL